MNGIEKAQETLIKSKGHILIFGNTRTGKSKLLQETNIPDSRCFDFEKMCKSTCYFDLPFLCRTNEEIYLDDILDAKESTVILDSVEFPQNIDDSFLYVFLKTMSARGKRVIAVALTSDTLENFKPFFEYEIETGRLEDGSFSCTTTSKSDSCWDILRNQYLDSYQNIEAKYDTLEIEDYMTNESVGRQITDYRKHTNGRPLLVVFPEHDDKNDCLNIRIDDDNEVDFALARDVSDQLSIIVNAFEKDNAQQIIVAAAGEIQSLVQKDCIDRSH
ncbi:hypothetical protein ACT99I_004481 [Salmonella enterica subsp. houtenae serovar [1],40:z4,z23:-]